MKENENSSEVIHVL